MSLKCLENKFCCIGITDAKALGRNLLSGLRPELTPLGNEEVIVEIEKDFGEHNFDFLVDDKRIKQHVDIWGAPFSLTYDLGETKEIEQVCISGYAREQGNHMISDFEIYASNDRESLYKPQNMVDKYFRGAEEDRGGAGAYYIDKLYQVEGSARYFGIKIISGCPNDEIARISRIALFNKENTAKFMLSDLLGANDMLKEADVCIKGDYIGNSENLTSGRAFFEDELLRAESDIELSFNPGVIGRLYLVGRNIEVLELASEGKKIDFKISENNSYNNEKIVELSFPVVETEDMKALVKKGAELDTVISDSEKIIGCVNTNEILEKDYIGPGCNCFPTVFSKFGIREGYNEVYWELEKHHIMKSKPHCIRMWFQIDWVVDTLEQYVSGDWQFDNAEMQSAVKFCEAFRDAGVEVELDFGWKVGSKVQDWFAIGGITPEQRHCAAPADLYNYGKAATATLEYLILEKGCDNVKYLGFYNEVDDVVNNSGHYDYAMQGDPIAYWAMMAKYAKHFIDEGPLKGMVEIWGAEQCVSFSPIMDKLNLLIPETFSRHTVHKYELSYEEICDWCEKELKPHSDGKPVLLTEFGNNHRKRLSWDVNHVCNILGGANHGLSGAFIWVLGGAPLVDPLNWVNSPSDMDETRFYWGFLPYGNNVAESGEAFYEMCLLNNYIPDHCQALKTEFSTETDTVRLNAFYKNGEYTVCVESKGDRENDIRIELDKEIGKTFYRHVYQRHEKGEGNLIVPPVDKTFEVDSFIDDTLPLGYSLVVYTTVKPITQVIMDNVDIKAKAGDKIAIGASLIDAPAEMEIKYSISKSLIKGATLENGIVKIPETAKSGDMLAVKAEIPSGEYGISIIRIA